MSDHDSESATIAPLLLLPLLLTACTVQVNLPGGSDDNETTTSAATTSSSSSPVADTATSSSTTSAAATSSSVPTAGAEAPRALDDFDFAGSDEAIAPGDLATLAFEQAEGITIAYVMVDNVREIPIAQVEEILGGPVTVGNDPSFQPTAFECVNLKFVIGGTTIPNTIGLAAPAITERFTLLNGEGKEAKQLVFPEAPLVCGDGELDPLPDNMDEWLDETVYSLHLATAVDGSPTQQVVGMGFKYDTPSLPELDGSLVAWVVDGLRRTV